MRDPGHTEPKVLIGLTITEDSNFVFFLTGRGRLHRFSKDQILSITETDQAFTFEVRE